MRACNDPSRIKERRKKLVVLRQVIVELALRVAQLIGDGGEELDLTLQVVAHGEGEVARSLLMKVRDLGLHAGGDGVAALGHPAAIALRHLALVLHLPALLHLAQRARLYLRNITTHKHGQTSFNQDR